MYYIMHRVLAHILTLTLMTRDILVLSSGDIHGHVYRVSVCE